MLTFNKGVIAQDHSKAIAAADTSYFSPNKNDGWQLFNSYISTYQKDSAQLEVIIQHSNTINWRQEQYIGRIKHQVLQPRRGQSLLFNLLSDIYKLRIEDNGKCYLSFVTGSLPVNNLVVIPVKIFYKL